MATLHQRPIQNGPSNGHVNQAPSQPSPQANLCNYCHKWPKNPGHNFCSKTCANRAGPTNSGFNGNTTNSRNNVNTANPNANANNASRPNSNLCNFCRKKPKLPPHDFCGKTCATNAGAAPGTSGPGVGGNFVHIGAPAPQPTQNQNQNQNRGGRGQGQGQGAKVQNGHKGGNGGFNHVNHVVAAPAPPMDPVEITKMVVDQIPYLKTFIPQNSPLFNGTVTAGNANSGTNSGSGSNAGPIPVNNTLGLRVTSPTSANASLVNSPNGTTVHILQVGNEADGDIEGDECGLPGCSNSRFVDANGVRSLYCSQRHRQEAVASGMVEPCIMCGLNPQGDGDYFCSRECREEALAKSAFAGVGGSNFQVNGGQQE